MLLSDLSGVDVALEQILDRIKDFTLKIHQSLDLSEILRLTVQEVRETLECDRAVIYRFLPEGDGVVAEESVNPEWQPILGQLIYDPCFNAKWREQYQQGRIGILEDIDAQLLQPCYKNLLTSLQVHAKLVAPILVSRHQGQGNATNSPEIWGLLIVHQCSSARYWQSLEIKFLQLITLQVGMVLQQLEIQQQLQQESIKAEIALQESQVVTLFTALSIHQQIAKTLTKQAERERMIYAIAQRIRQSLDLEQILNTTVDEVRHFLQTDRVIIYRFNPNWSGVVVEESVGEGWLKILNMEITDTYFVEKKGQSYDYNTARATADIYQSGFADCHIELLEKLQVRAKLVVPILQGDNLWGLLVAHHCSSPRQWYPWESELLQQLATQVAIAIQQSELHQQLQIANKQLENLALVDQLTQVANRRCFDRAINQEWIRAIREQHPLSLLLCDIDYFKQYNDTYGHTDGDICLKIVAQALKETVKRSTDLVARYGGEEFAIILPNTNTNGAVEVAQKIHQAIEEKNIPHISSAVSEFITISIGIATIIPTRETVPLNLIEKADRALYQAKSNGRNRYFIDINCQ